MKLSKTLLLLPLIALALLILASVEANAPCAVPSQIVVLQNRERRHVGVPLLVWSKSLDAHAEWWANVLVDHGCTTVRSSHGKYGENLSRSNGSSSSPAYVAVVSWVVEKVYNCEKNSCTQDHECHHYTQIVWRKKREVGCAQASCSLVTGDSPYDPPGNVFEDRPYRTKAMWLALHGQVQGPQQL